MKKRLGMLLAVLMLVSCLSPAWAVEGEAAQSDFERMGPYLNWTDEQKTEAFNTWDDVRWDDYWYGGYNYETGEYYAGYYDLAATEEEFDQAFEQWLGDRQDFFQDFAQIGAYGTWTDEQKDLAFEEWSSQRWEAYWQAYYDSYEWPDTTQYEVDTSNYYRERYAHMSASDCGAENIRQEKADMGMPWPDGINVTLNGEYLTLDGVEPIAVESRTMVPVRAFLESMGAEVSYKSGVISVKLENGDSMEMKTDSTVLVHTVGDKIVETDMGVTPYAGDGRVYIPARFAGEAMGLSVAWDSKYQVAHFTDWDKIAADLDENFTAVNALLGAEGEKMDPEQTYAIDATASGAVTLYGETERDNGTAKLEGSAKGLLQGGKLDLAYGMKLDLGKLEEMLVPETDAETMAALELLSDFRVQMRGDMGEGTFYLKGNQLDQLSDGAVPSNTWISVNQGQGIDVDAYYESLNAQAGREAATVGERLVAIYRLTDYAYGGIAPCANALAMANPVVFFLGDENFKVTTAGNTTTYTMKMDSAKLMERYKELMGDTVNEYVLEYMTNMLSSMTVNFGFTARMRDNKIVDSKLEGNISLPAAMTGSIPAELSFDLSSSPRHVSGSYTLRGEYIGKMEMKLDLKMTDSNKTVPTAPAAGEKVVDVEELTGSNPGEELSTAMETGLSLAAALLK